MLPVTGFFSDKMKLFVEGRKEVFTILEERISSEDKLIWIHAASLGEYEQAVPIIHRIRKNFTDYRILITFFSPSGYEIKKNSELVDIVTYLPLDTPTNVQRFLNHTNPQLALFIKYEFWPNYLSELKFRDIPTLLISGAFRKDQIFFKPYGKWMRQYLSTFEHFFLQNHSSESLLQSIGYHNTSVSGDTRFDRVASQLEQDNKLDFVEDFKEGKRCIVIGSSWPEDEALWSPLINGDDTDTKYIIAPHTIKNSRITEVESSLQVPTVRYTENQNENLKKFKVLIIDTIGLLTKIYSYADIAYVGGAAGNTGLHNILEPATFNVPIIIGQNYEKFPEAVALEKLGGLISVETSEELHNIVIKLLSDQEYTREVGDISGSFIRQNTGATDTIMKYLSSRPLKNKR